MNNKEKREYINCLTLLGQNCFINEIQKRNQVLSKAPSKLYKYRTFDKYAFEMIREGYTYLSPVNDLDDPFDCISDFDLSKLFDSNNKMIKDQFLEYVIKTSSKRIAKEHLHEYKKIVKSCLISEGLDFYKTISEFQKYGVSEKEAENLFNFFVNCKNVFEAYDDANAFLDFANVAYRPENVIGVCSLSENRDNKVMWSLYGKQYKGYCIEYDIPFTTKVMKALYPVLYSRKISNNFAIRMYDTMIAQVKRNIFHNPVFIDVDIENIGAIYELFCVKDTDWKYQQEWRIIGSATSHCKELTIKAIYLGFKVSKINEKKMLSCSKKYGFDLFKMKKPSGKKKIGYIKLN